MPEKITKKDLDILGKLEENARIPLKAIAKAVHMSPEAVSYRISRLEKAGCIIRYHTITNYFKLGFYKYKLYMRLKAPKPALVDEICSYFKEHKKTEWVAHTAGRWDVIAAFLIRTPVEFADEIEKFMEKYSEVVLERAVTQTLYLAHQPRGSVVESEAKSIVYHTLTDKPRPADELDMKILRAIANNARAPVKTIAKAIGSTPRKVAYRMKQLEDDEVILAYKAHINVRAFGRSFNKLILYLKSMDSEKREKFIKFCGAMPNVVWPQKVLGAWDFEIDLDAAEDASMYAAISSIYEKFPDAILNHEHCLEVKEYKLDLFPGALPEFK